MIRERTDEDLLALARQLLRYGVTGGTGLLFNLALLAVLVELAGVPATWGPILSTSAAFGLTFLLTERWVFGRFRSPDARTVAGRATAYYGVMAAGKLLNYGIYLLLLGWAVPYLLAWVVGSVLVFFGTFAANRYLWTTVGGGSIPERALAVLRRWGEDRPGLDDAFVALVAGVWAVLYLRNLGDQALRVWDESRYANPALQAVQHGHWVIPHVRVNTYGEDLALTPRLIKPPLMYWLEAASMLAFGTNEFAVRLPSAVATLGCALLVYWIGRTAFDRWSGLASAFVFLIVPNVLVGTHGGRWAVSDTTLMLFGSCFVWWTWRGRDDRRLLVPAGIAAGLAVLTKGVAAGVFVIVLLPVLLVYGRSYVNRYTGAAVASTILVALPWHLYVWMEYGAAFVRQYFVLTVLKRTRGQLLTPGDPMFEFMNYPYVWYLRESTAASLMLIWGPALVAWRLSRDDWREHASELFFLWWLISVPLTFAVGGGNHPWYVLPMFVPGAVLVGTLPATAFRTVASRFDGSPTVGQHATYAALGLVCVLVLSPPVYPVHQAAEEQRTVGQSIEATVPDDESVYVQLASRSVANHDLMSLSFYARRPLVRASENRLATDPTIRYAIVPYEPDRRPGRPHRVVSASPENGIAFVEFETSERTDLVR